MEFTGAQVIIASEKWSVTYYFRYLGFGGRRGMWGFDLRD